MPRKRMSPELRKRKRALQSFIYRLERSVGAKHIRSRVKKGRA